MGRPPLRLVPYSQPPCERRAASGCRPLRTAVPTSGSHPLRAGPSRSRSPTCRGALAAAWPWVAGPTWGLAVAGRPSSLLPSLRKRSKNAEIVYPCISDPDGEDEGGQASYSLAVSTRWISTAKLLQFDFATLAQREGGE
ncbi:hypothetical protein GW17_00034468 [Ensete ventricosum]|nr:hypothetical protein GW17_00034468 [Ensete ventricosum]